MEILCSACGGSNPKAAFFCNSCGANLFSDAEELEDDRPITAPSKSDQGQSESMPYFPPEALHSKDGETLAQEDVHATFDRLKRIPRWGWLSLAALAALTVTVILALGPLSEISRKTRACDAGDAQVCDNLGFSYYWGHGVSQDYAKALSLYSIACDAGNADACVWLGEMYRDERGVTKDWHRARTYYKRACDLGDGDGCGNVEYIEKEEEEAREGKPPAESAHDAIPLFTAVQIGESARANFGRFESDFENKTVRFTGTIQDIGASSFRMHSVTEMYILVRDLPMSQLHDLSTGDNVEVTGSFTGDIDPRRGFDFPSVIFTGTEARKR